MNEQDISITIIVTVYNKASDLPQCLQSLDNQRDQHFYTLIIDDGSVDQSTAFLGRWKASHENVTVLRQRHSGVSAARNLGLSLVQTKYVMFLDGDDRLSNCAVERMNKEIQHGLCDLTVFGISHLLPDGRTVQIRSAANTYPTRDSIRNDLAGIWNSGLMYSSCNKLFCMDLIQANRITFPLVDFGEDIVFCREYLKRCRSLCILPESLYLYTYHGSGTLSSRYRENLFDLRLEEHKQMLAYFESFGIPSEETLEYLARRYIERIVGCIENEHSPESKYSLRDRYHRIKQIVFDPYTQPCAAFAKHSGWKMRLLIRPILKQQTPLVFLLGAVMSFCRRHFPRLFASLKYR